jgi:hypothetical protein
MSKIWVRIQAKETVYYDQLVQMDEEDFHHIQNSLEADWTAGEELLEGYIDRSNVLDVADFELTDNLEEEN